MPYIDLFKAHVQGRKEAEDAVTFAEHRSLLKKKLVLLLNGSLKSLGVAEVSGR